MTNYFLYLYLLGFLGALYLVYEIVRRYQIPGWIVFGVIPLLLSPLIIANISIDAYGESIPFLIVKFYSVMLVAILAQFCRFTKLKEQKWPYRLVYFLVLLNIFEACFEDITHGILINGIAGLLLAATLPTFNQSRIKQTGKVINFEWDTTRLWIIGYTIWNLVFVYNRFPNMIGMHMVILGLALVVGLYRNELWLQARGFILGIYLCSKFIFPQLFTPMQIYTWENSRLFLIFGIISLAYMLLFVFYPKFIKDRYFKKS